jgi:hypothetical protein
MFFLLFLLAEVFGFFAEDWETKAPQRENRESGSEQAAGSD